MNEIDTEKIKKMTNNLIAYNNYEKEQKMKNKKLKNTLYTFLGLCIIIGGTITIDAATNNKISNLVKEVLTIKINGEEKNANCEKLTNGNYKCTLDKNITGTDGELTLEYNKDLLNGLPEIKFNNILDGDEVIVNLNNLPQNSN